MEKGRIISRIQMYFQNIKVNDSLYFLLLTTMSKMAINRKHCYFTILSQNFSYIKYKKKIPNCRS